jgi:ABC-type maltose transport system permease subunit
VSLEEERNNLMKTKDTRTLRDNVRNFVLLFHNLDNETYGSWCENGVLKVVIQTITNNAITTKANHPMAPLRGSGRNLVH